MGETRRAASTGPVALEARPVALDPARPGFRRLGPLTYLGGVELRVRDKAFGGYSALAVEGDRFTVLNDRGGLLAFRMGQDLRPRGARMRELPGGPRTGWRNEDRDGESLARNPATGRWWVGFEKWNEVWRYAPGFAAGERGHAPPAMRGWREAGGPESMARLRDGRFVLISETTRPPRGRGRDGLIFAGDPTDPRVVPLRFGYLPAPGFDPVDMAELPDGRVLVLERRFDPPFRWSNRLVLVERGAIRPGTMVRGRELARLAAPLVHDNFEGVAAAREGGGTVVWLVSDDNQLFLQRTLLLKFRLG